jgi:hypothetical protein
VDVYLLFLAIPSSPPLLYIHHHYHTDALTGWRYRAQLLIFFPYSFSLYVCGCVCILKTVVAMSTTTSGPFHWKTEKEKKRRTCSAQIVCGRANHATGSLPGHHTHTRTKQAPASSSSSSDLLLLRRFSSKRRKKTNG